MKYLLIALAILLYLYLTFIAAPSVLAFYIIFGRRRTVPFADKSLAGTQYAPYEGLLSDAREALSRRQAEDVTIRSGDGTELFGRFYDGGGSTTVICFHGYNSSQMNNFAFHAEFFLNKNCSVLLTDERAHGKSGGRRSGLGFLEKNDVIAWTEYMHGRDPSQKIVLYGISMGAAAIMYACDRIDPAVVSALVIDCGYEAPYDQIAKGLKTKFLPVPLMMPYLVLFGKLYFGVSIRTSTTETLKKNAIPAVFLAGAEDRIVSEETVRKLYDACVSPKALVHAPGAGHTLSFVVSEDVRRQATDFLAQYVKL